MVFSYLLQKFTKGLLGLSECLPRHEGLRFAK